MCKNFNVSVSVRVDCGFIVVGVRCLFLQLRLDSKEAQWRQLFYHDEILHEQIEVRRRYFWHEGEIVSPPSSPDLFLEELEVINTTFNMAVVLFVILFNF